MVVRMCAAVCGLLGGLVGWQVYGAAPGQEAPGGAATAPAEAAQQTRPKVTYDSLQAGRDAYRIAEEQRRWAIDRQLWLLDEVKRYNTWIDSYVPGLTEIYAYGSRSAARRAYRHGYGPLFTPWPMVPGDIYGYPYYPWVRQPIGHERIWTGPNSYIYCPRHAPPALGQNVPPPAAPLAPMPASPSTHSQPPGASLGEQAAPPALVPPAGPMPETIPAPPEESGPREF